MSKSDWLREQRETKSSGGGGNQSVPTTGAVLGQEPVNMARVQAPRPLEAKRGRPLDVDKAKTLMATKPWVAAGLSRRTWYRRRAVGGST